MLDVSVSYNRYKFLGHEFLTWLWFAIENDQTGLEKTPQEGTTLHIGNRLVLENRNGTRSESITIQGDDAGLEEAVLALKKGAVVTELNLFYKAGEAEWRFTIKAESLHLTSLKCPTTGSAASQEELEGAILEKAYLYGQVFSLVDNLFRQYIGLRLSEKWSRKTVPQMKLWIQGQAS